MRRFHVLLLTAAIPFALTVAMTGCGGDATTAPSTPATSPPVSGGTGGSTPAPSPTPTPTPTPTPVPSAPATIQWQATLNNTAGDDRGSVSVDTNGNVSITAKHGAPNTSYEVEFCRFPNSTFGDVQTCMSLSQTLLSDANGNGSLNFHFPKSGAWSGQFFIRHGICCEATYSSWNTGSANFTGGLLAQLIQVAGSNQTATCSVTQDPLTSGTVTVDANRNGTATVKGAVPNATYTIIAENGGASSSNYQQGTFSTDSSGNGTGTFPAEARPDSDFVIIRAQTSSCGFYSGFRVP